jgi:hypothetical protein
MVKRAGLTLIDIVVVVFLFLTTLGFLLTYILRQRENAMRVQCMDNLRRIGGAARTFHDTSGVALAGPAAAFLPAARIADGYATWAVQLAPHLASSSPLDAWDLQRSYFAQGPKAREATLASFFCPARLRVRTTLVSSAGDLDPATGAHVPGGLGDYAGVAGNGDPAHDWTGPDANGPIILGEVLQKEESLILRWRGRVSLNDLTRGQSYTLLFGEKHVPVTGLGQPQFGDGSLYDGALPANSTRVGGAGHGLAQAADDPYRTNFGSYHPGICLFAQADAAVRPVAVTIDPELLGTLTTR